MKTFLREVAEYILKVHEGDLEKIAIVVPTRRAGVFCETRVGQCHRAPNHQPGSTGHRRFCGKREYARSGRFGEFAFRVVRDFQGN